MARVQKAAERGSRAPQQQHTLLLLSDLNGSCSQPSGRSRRISCADASTQRQSFHCQNNELHSITTFHQCGEHALGCSLTSPYKHRQGSRCIRRRLLRSPRPGRAAFSPGSEFLAPTSILCILLVAAGELMGAYSRLEKCTQILNPKSHSGASDFVFHDTKLHSYHFETAVQESSQQQKHKARFCTTSHNQQ